LNKIFRVIDTGDRGGRANIAFDQALIDAHRDGLVPDTIRFLHFPPCVLIGRHQALRQEVEIDYCQKNDIEIGRRITGGGAIYLDAGQLGWELVFHRATLGVTSLAELASEICVAAATGLQGFGIDARFRPRNDIEVDGRKISGTGGFFDGDTLFFQGTLLVDVNTDHMHSTLKVPSAKLAKRGITSAAGRITTLAALLGEQTPTMAAVEQALLNGFRECLGIETVAGEITEEEEIRAERLLAEEIGTDAFVSEIDEPAADRGLLRGTCVSAGGTIDAYVRVEGPQQSRVREILFTGDFFVTPPRVILDLEASLRGLDVDALSNSVDNFFERAEVGMLSVRAEDFSTAIAAALNEGKQSRTGAA
jgi:lipoate-protein ligase A